MKKQEYHLKDSELATLDTNKNQQALLKHIRDCPFCSKRLAQILQKDILPAPHYLKQNILAKKQYLKRKKQEFTAYCIKIGLAVAACLAIIFLSNPTENFSSLERYPPKATTIPETIEKPKRDLSQDIYRGTTIINQKIIDFTDNLTHITF